MNRTRIVSGTLGFLLVAFVLIFANVYVVDIAFAMIAILTLQEYFKALKQKAKPVVEIGYLSAAMIAIIHLIPQLNILKMIAIFVPVCILYLFARVIISNNKITIIDIAVTFFGICYIVLFLMFLPVIHGMENGKVLVWFAPLIAWGTDTFAYIIGRNFGKHKFSEISPNKSMEGCIGGLLGGILIAIAYTWMINTYFSMHLSYIWIGGISFLLSIISQIGDFSASAIKRYVGIKDFSHLIPGHGGMLDRIDSVIFVAPFAYIFLMFL